MVPSRSNFDSLDRLQIYTVASWSALDSIDRLQIYMVSSWQALDSTFFLSLEMPAIKKIPNESTLLQKYYKNIYNCIVYH